MISNGVLHKSILVVVFYLLRIANEQIKFVAKKKIKIILVESRFGNGFIPLI